MRLTRLCPVDVVLRAASAAGRADRVEVLDATHGDTDEQVVHRQLIGAKSIVLELGARRPETSDRQRSAVNTKKLMRLIAHLPANWAEQRALLGFR